MLISALQQIRLIDSPLKRCDYSTLEEMSCTSIGTPYVHRLYFSQVFDYMEVVMLGQYEEGLMEIKCL